MSLLRKAAVVAATALLAVALAAPATAAAPSGPVAGLGDSYAAGYGIALPTATNPCAVSAKAYPFKLSPGQPTVDLACAGADIGDVAAHQVARIPAGTKIVTLTVGGNDVGWAYTIQTCLTAQTPQQQLACQSAVTATQQAIGALPVEIAELVVAIQAQAPGARIYVTGYPKLFQPTATNACAALPQPTQQALAGFDDLAVALNAAIAGGARLGGASYVSVTGAFAGHGVCYADSSWIFPADSAGALHPTVAGQSAYARVLRAAGAR